MDLYICSFPFVLCFVVLDLCLSVVRLDPGLFRLDLSWIRFRFIRILVGFASIYISDITPTLFGCFLRLSPGFSLDFWENRSLFPFALFHQVSMICSKISLSPSTSGKVISSSLLFDHDVEQTWRLHQYVGVVGDGASPELWVFEKIWSGFSRFSSRSWPFFHGWGRLDFSSDAGSWTRVDCSV